MYTNLVMKALFFTKPKIKTKILHSFHIFYYIFALLISELLYYKKHKFSYCFKVFLIKFTQMWILKIMANRLILIFNDWATYFLLVKTFFL